jgi:hypothetical protein
MFKWRSSLAHHMKTRHKVNVLTSPLHKSPSISSPAAVVRYTTVESPNGSSSAGQNAQHPKQGDFHS